MRVVCGSAAQPSCDFCARRGGLVGAELVLFGDQCIIAANFSVDAIKAFLQAKNVPVPGKCGHAHMLHEARTLGHGQSSPSTIVQSFSCHRGPFVCCCLDDILCRPSTYRQQVIYH